VREDRLTRHLETLDEHVKEERGRLHEAKTQQALQALISLSLPELLGEVTGRTRKTLPANAFWSRGVMQTISTADLVISLVLALSVATILVYGRG
jgi:hypothetical protein